LSGLRDDTPARRSARTGGSGTVVIRWTSQEGEGHDALFAQGLDNPLWVAHLSHPDGYDGPTSRTIPIIYSV
jgi:hypothetical protein